jgi:hypothetical protein
MTPTTADQARSASPAVEVPRIRSAIEAYGLHCPDLTEAREAVHRVSPSSADAVWARLLHSASLRGDEADESALQAILLAMNSCGDPVIALCARALTIRMTSFHHLAATHEIVRRPQ